MRVGGVKPVDVRQQDNCVSPCRLSDTRRQPVIIAKADFGGSDAVILVHHRHDAQRHQPFERRRRIEIATAIFQVVERHQHLRGSYAAFVQQAGPALRQGDLPGCRCCMCILQAAAPALGQFQPARAQRDRAGRYDDHLLPRAFPRRDVGDQRTQPVHPHLTRRIDQQGRADLDDQTANEGGGKAGEGGHGHSYHSVRPELVEGPFFLEETCRASTGSARTGVGWLTPRAATMGLRLLHPRCLQPSHRPALVPRSAGSRRATLPRPRQCPPR